MKANKIIETQEVVNSTIAQRSLGDIQAEFDNLKFNYERVNEQLQSLDIMLDNHGWSELLGGGLEFGGPRIDQIKLASMQLRELTAVNAHLKRGNLLRTNYVLEGGPNYEGIGGSRGAGNKNIQAAIDDPINQHEFFSLTARKKRMKARYTDGHAIWIGDDRTMQLKMVPFEKVTGTLTNPEDSSEIWALRIMRQISPNKAGMSAPNLEARWIFLDEFISRRVGGVPNNNLNRTIPFDPQNNGTMVDEAIDFNSRIFMEVANAQVGWRWGTPDALAAMAWVRMYREFMISGKKMSDAMAMLWGQYRSTAAGGANASVQLGGNTQGAGGTSISGGEYNIFSTAGKSYDFDAGRALLAAAATSLELSVIDLASDPGAAGSSYGSAQTLDLPGRIAISAIRDEVAEMDARVLKWLGAKNPTVWFDSLLDADAIYRMMQAEQFYWSNGLREAAEQKSAMDAIKGKPNDLKPTVPTGVMLPNNEQWPNSLTNDDQTALAAGAGSGGSASSTPNAKQQVSPDQGKSNGTGGAGNLGNQRKDVISK